MRLLAFGGDMRMNGAVLAARRAGWDAEWLRAAGDAAPDRADAVLLPWPRSFADGRLNAQPPGDAPALERVRALVPPCRLLLLGAGARAEDFPQAARVLDPNADEEFLLANAALTAEGALSVAMRAAGRALLGSTCLVAGFGRIGRALASRLVALGAFTVVCARSEAQMRAAHALGAHPVPLSRLAEAAAPADVIFNTIPARVFGAEALAAIRPGAPLIELAGAPHGEDVEQALRLGVSLRVEGGLPGRYAPGEAGTALFEAARRALADEGTGGKDCG